jgi:hypothetical protein
MCHFLTVAVRPGDASLLEPLREAGFQLEPSSNRDMSAALGRGVSALLTFKSFFLGRAFFLQKGANVCDFRTSVPIYTVR